MKAEAAAKAGVDPAHVTLWIEYNIVKPKPVVEPPREQRTGPVAETRYNALAEPRPPFTRTPDATAIEERPVSISAPEPERPREIDYPDAGVA